MPPIQSSRSARRGRSDPRARLDRPRPRRDLPGATPPEIEIDGGHHRLAERAAEAALAAAGVVDGHLAIAFVDREEMRALNLARRGRDEPTDVLSFPIDGAGPAAGPRELGDVVICPEETADIGEAVVHGVLHLAGYDHEVDDGRMLDLQEQIVAGLR